MIADLHVHTDFSDGADAPLAVVQQAKAMGLTALAISDHDTVEGIPEGLEAGMTYQVEVIPAIEFGTRVGAKDVHILGYFVDIKNPELVAKLTLFRQKRIERMRKMVNTLHRLGVSVDNKRVLELAGRGSVGRPHLAKAMLEAGIVATMGEAFDKYIGNGKPAFEPRYPYTPEEAVGLIRRAGGVAVFAHPGLAGCNHIIQRLVDIGLQGLEVYHPSHQPSVRMHYLQLCQQYGLLATGGSDYHGHHREFVPLGAETVDYQVVMAMKAIAGIKNGKKEDG